MTYKLSILGSIFLVGGTAVVVWLFLKVIKSLRSRTCAIMYTRRRLPIIKVGMFMLGAVLIILSQFLFWVNANLEAFSPVDPGRPVAIIDFLHPEGCDPIMSLATRASDSGQMIPTEIVMRTDVASLEVEILRFPKWFNFMDVKDSYRISSVRFIGTHNEPYDRFGERRIQKEVEPFWSFLNKIGRFVPAVAAVKINSDPIYFEQGVQLQVYTSTSRVVLTQR